MKKILSFILVVLMLVSIFSANVFAGLGGPLPTDTLPGVDLNKENPYTWAGRWENTEYDPITLSQDGTLFSGTYPDDDGRLTGKVEGNLVYGQYIEGSSYAPPKDNGDFEFVMSDDGMSFTGHVRYGAVGTGWRKWNGKRIIECSDWALEEIKKAYKLGIMPDVLTMLDLTQPITREEFAALSVKAYEVMANTKATASKTNPFKDTVDQEVLKAYNVGITSGVSDDRFDPKAVLNREQAATMLTRVYKKTNFDGWSIENDAQFPLTYDKPQTFSDDENISSWAKDSVYFMVANSVINGVGNNKFAPQNITAEEEASGYANATREQAILIAVRMVENLK